MIDFPQLCRDYGIPYSQTVAGWTNINCPYHENGIRGYKGGLNNSEGYYNCWSCGSTNLHKVLSDIIGITEIEVKNILPNYINDISIKKQIVKKLNTKIKLPITELNDIAKRYLIKRKFDPDYLQEKYKVSGVLLTGVWAGRLIIPIFYNNELVSWQGRSILNKEKCKELDILRYKTLSKDLSVIDPKTILYNLDNCKFESIILVEGPFDCWRFGDNCAATLGTSTTQAQMNLLHKYKKVYIIFDPEKEAQQRALKIYSNLKMSTNVFVVDTELGHDPGDMTEKEVSRLKRRLGI